MTIEEKIVELITGDNWFKTNHPDLVPKVGNYMAIGNTYPSLAYNLTDGKSEAMIPAARSMLTFVMYGVDEVQTYGILKDISLNIQRLINRKPQNLCDLEDGLRVVGCVKTGGESFFNKDINKCGRDLVFEIVMSEEEDYTEPYETPADVPVPRKYIYYTDQTTGKLVKTWYEDGQPMSQVQE